MAAPWPVGPRLFHNTTATIRPKAAGQGCHPDRRHFDDYRQRPRALRNVDAVSRQALLRGCPVAAPTGADAEDWTRRYKGALTWGWGMSCGRIFAPEKVGRGYANAGY